MTPSETLAVGTANKIIAELSGRSGFGNAWDECDDEVREEIRHAIAVYVLVALQKSPV